MRSLFSHQVAKAGVRSANAQGCAINAHAFAPSKPHFDAGTYPREFRHSSPPLSLIESAVLPILFLFHSLSPSGAARSSSCGCHSTSASWSRLEGASVFLLGGEIPGSSRSSGGLSARRGEWMPVEVLSLGQILRRETRRVTHLTGSGDGGTSQAQVHLTGGSDSHRLSERPRKGTQSLQQESSLALPGQKSVCRPPRSRASSFKASKSITTAASTVSRQMRLW